MSLIAAWPGDGLEGRSGKAALHSHWDLRAKRPERAGSVRQIPLRGRSLSEAGGRASMTRRSKERAGDTTGACGHPVSGEAISQLWEGRQRAEPQAGRPDWAKPHPCATGT